LYSHLVLHYQQHRRKVFLCHLIDHTLKIYPQTQTLEPTCTALSKQHHRKVLLSSFHLIDHTGNFKNFYPRTQHVIQGLTLQLFIFRVSKPKSKRKSLYGRRKGCLTLQANNRSMLFLIRNSDANLTKARASRFSVRAVVIFTGTKEVAFVQPTRKGRV